MIGALARKIFGSANERRIKAYQSRVDAINALEAEIAALSDEALKARTTEFKKQLADGKTTLDDLLVPAFATVREAAKRTLGQRHFDVQLIGGAVLHEGKISEMRTGEGKTLVATLAAYFNALPGKGVHVVTVNDYLARRDAEWMGRIYRFLGLTVGVVTSGQSAQEKRDAYAADITYATNNELGFDYLRDNMAFAMNDKVQRGQNFAIVDEVDSILVDEARTPLIISGPTDDDPALWRQLNTLIPKLVAQKEEEGPGDFFLDLKAKQAYLSEEGHEKIELLLRTAGLLSEDESLYDPGRIVLMHHLNALLRAHHLYRRDVEYIVRGGQVVIIDEFTGRMMVGRRWSDGLHQAVEAKEGVDIQQENQTLASITFQNYFRLYNKLSGMTGTADTEAYEFQNIYNLEVVVIPTNRAMVRQDHGDQVYMTSKEKFGAVAQEIVEARKRGQPVLVGTASIETSELLSGMLKSLSIPHEVLNAKQHEREAEIVAQAGRPGAVTIATNMAGRGTDIVMGGNLESELHRLAPEDEAGRSAARAEWQKRHDDAIAAGGLYVIGSERHESRRIDNQLRGRSGRQGDAGASRFYLSLEDQLMKIFLPPSMQQMLQGLGMQEGEVLEHRWVTRAIETAQRKVEAHNFDIRKNLLEYDNVANEQRKAVYELRDELMAAERVTPLVDEIRSDVVNAVIDVYIPPQTPEEMWNVQGLEEALHRDLSLVLPLRQWLTQEKDLQEKAVRERVIKAAAEAYGAKREKVGPPILDHFEKAITLQLLDRFWREHLAAMDYLRQGIHLRGYAQKDPKQEYKREAFTMFNDMLARFKHEVITALANVQIRTEAEVQQMEAERRQQQPRLLEFQHADAPAALAEAETIAAAQPQGPLTVELAQPEAPGSDLNKVGRNDPCPCGSGKKYKQCHGRLA